MLQYTHLFGVVLTRVILTTLLVIALSACGDSSTNTKKNSSTSDETAAQDNTISSIYANSVVEYLPVPLSKKGKQFYDPSAALREAGNSLNVVSLGFDSTLDNATGGSVTLGLGTETTSYCIVDGSGDDFIVIENAFYIEGDSTRSYNEVAYVEVSEDGTTFFRFSNSVDFSLSVEKVDRYKGFAGVHPDGDRFDLNSLITSHNLPSSFSACFIRLIDAGTQVLDADSTSPVSNASGADINAVQALNFFPL